MVRVRDLLCNIDFEKKNFELALRFLALRQTVDLFGTRGKLWDRLYTIKDARRLMFPCPATQRQTQEVA